ncbi:helix-turn-helix transcriptional regulator [Streptomyces sp. NPDC004647]|uniref:helix-turn-helix domain-containing protein n=1 Tax=Streptomyces sp. NPDC004647 TaxID=3154671 RepID=UPI0033AA4BAF
MGSNASASTGVRVFGNQLKMFRELAEMSRADLAGQVGYSEETVKAVELARRIAKKELVEKADEVLGARGILTAAIPALEEARYPEFFRDFAKLEAEALSLYFYAPHAIPGLLQIEEYAQAVIGARVPSLSDEEIARRVSARMDRQAVLVRDPLPMLNFVIDQVVLERPIGGRSVQKRQLGRLLEGVQLRHVSFQVLPTACEEHPGLEGQLTVVETPEPRTLAYVEGQGGSLLVSD